SSRAALRNGTGGEIMASIITFLPFLLLLLACPLGMVAIGVVAWAWARAHGEKKDFSMGCMSGKCNHAEHQNHSPRDNDGALREQVVRLQAEVDSLREQSGTM